MPRAPYVGALVCALAVACGASPPSSQRAAAPARICELRRAAPYPEMSFVPLEGAPCDVVSAAELSALRGRDGATLTIRFVLNGTIDSKKGVRLTVEGRSASDERVFMSKHECLDARAPSSPAGSVAAQSWNQEYVHLKSDQLARTSSLRFVFEEAH